VKHSISLWFFIGSLLTVYALLILGAGIAQIATGGTTGIALPQLHISVWWGLGMLPLSLAFMIKDWPKRDKPPGN
jgi:hypothetical protein